MKKSNFTAHSRSLIRTLTVCAFICLPTSLKAQTLMQQEDAGTWINGRAFVQHLHALQSTPQSLFFQFATKQENQQAKLFNECLSRVRELAEQFPACSRLALAQVRESFARREPISADLLAKVRIVAVMAENSKTKQPWQAWLNYAAIETMAGEFGNANRYLSLARASAADSWVMDRLELFGRGLAALSVSNQRTAKTEASVESVAEQSGLDSQTSYLRSKMEQVIAGLNRKSQLERRSQIAEKRLNDLTRERWVLMQDRVELEGMKKAVAEGNLSMDTLRRIDSLFVTHGVDDKAWRAIVSSMVSVLARGEGLASQQGLSLAVESWLAGTPQDNPVLGIDDDNVLSRHHLILDSYIDRLGQILAEIAVGLRNQNDRAVVLALSERMRGMLGPVSAVVNSLNAQEKMQVSLSAKRAITGSGRRLQRAQALLASIELLGPESSQQLFEQLKDFRDEIKILKAEREEVMSQLMSTTVQLIPVSLAQFEALSLRIDQVKKSIEDLRRVVAVNKEREFVDSQTNYFIVESMQFLDRLAAEARSRISDKREQNRKIASGFKMVSSEMVQLRKQMDDFVTSQSELLRPRLATILSNLESELLSRDRTLDVQEQVAKSEIRDLLRNDLESESRNRERINDLRRIRGENLEWRFGR